MMMKKVFVAVSGEGGRFAVHGQDNVTLLQVHGSLHGPRVVRGKFARYADVVLMLFWQSSRTMELLKRACWLGAQLLSIFLSFLSKQCSWHVLRRTSGLLEVCCRKSQR